MFKISNDHRTKKNHGASVVIVFLKSQLEAINLANHKAITYQALAIMQKCYAQYLL